jgi:hypothetical protein
MRQEMKDKINSLDPRVREKLIKRLTAEKLVKEYSVEIDFDEIDLDNFAKELADAIRKRRLDTTEIHKFLNESYEKR